MNLILAQKSMHISGNNRNNGNNNNQIKPIYMFKIKLYFSRTESYEQDVLCTSYPHQIRIQERDILDMFAFGLF